MEGTVSKITVNEGDQYEFSGLERPKKLNDTPAQVWFSNKDKGVAVLRQLTKTGMVSRDESKQFILSFDVINSYGRVLEGDERIYPDLPSELSGLLKFTGDEGMTVSDARKHQIIDALEDHCNSIDDKIEELESMQKTAQAIIERYEKMMSGNGNNGNKGILVENNEEVVEEDEDDILVENNEEVVQF